MSTSRFALSVVAALLSLLLTSSVRADGAAVAAAERLLADASFEEAHTSAERARAAGRLGRAELARAYRVLALSAAALGRAPEAEAAFARLIVLDPAFTLDPSLGPRVQAPFFEARGFWQKQPGPAGLEASARAVAGEPARITITVRDPLGLARTLVITHRFGGVGDYRPTEIAASPSAVVELSRAASATGATLSYFVAALDENRSVVFEIASASEPRELPAAPAAVRPLAPARPAPARPAPPPRVEPGRSIFESPVFWVAAGLAVAAGVVTGVAVAAR